MIVFDPVLIDVIRNTKGKVLLGKIDEFDFLEPTLENVGRNRRAKLVGDAFPSKAEMSVSVCVIHRGGVLCNDDD